MKKGEEMRKLLLALSLAGIIGLSYCTVANAASFTITKPSIQVNTDQEESAISKKMKEIEQAKKDAEARQAQREKAAKAKQEAFKNNIEQMKKDAEEQQAQREKAAKAKQQQRKDAINSFKNSFK